MRQCVDACGEEGPRRAVATVAPNGDELLAMAALLPRAASRGCEGDASELEAAVRLIQAGVDVVLVKRGAEGAAAYARHLDQGMPRRPLASRSRRMTPPSSAIGGNARVLRLVVQLRTPAVHVPDDCIVDVTGAGDTALGAFLATLARFIPAG